MIETSKIYVVQHGQDTDAAAKIVNGHTLEKRNVGLTTLGVKQSHELTGKLVDKNIQAIISSPLKRSLDTANIIADQLGIHPVISRWGFAERNMGKLTGTLVVDMPKNASEIFIGQRALYCLQGNDVESFSKTFIDVRKTLNEIKDSHQNENILIVTHAEIVKLLCAAFGNLKWHNDLLKPYFGYTDIIELRPEISLSN